MKTKLKSRARMLKARDIQLAAATGKLSSANARVSNLADNQEAIAAMRHSFSPVCGHYQGGAMSRLGEFSARLDGAAASVSVFIAHAQQDAALAMAETIARRIDQNASEKLHEKSLREIRARLEQRQSLLTRPRQMRS
ncbi:MAG: hypothetical protein ABL909_00855 [Sphingopyxis sp.]